MFLARVLPFLIAAPVVACATPSASDPAPQVNRFIVASDPASHTVISCRSLPTGIGDLQVIALPPSSDAKTPAGAVVASAPAPPGLALAGALAEPSHGPLDVSFSLPDAARARLELLDVQGRRIQAIEVGDLGPGTHVARLGAVPGPGVYFLRLSSDGRSLTHRVTLVP